MGIEREFIAWGKEAGGTRQVTDVRIGLGYTAVEVEGEDVGLAYTFRQEAGHTCTAMAQAGNLSGQTASQLLELLSEKHAISAAIGLATLNALAQKEIGDSLPEDFFPLIRLKPDDHVGMVGYFAPVIPIIRKAGSTLVIFEKNRAKGEGALPPEELPQKLPDCSVIILSATTLINHTFANIVPYCKNAREVVILGPSTPLIPEILGKYGITLLAGMRTVDPARVLKIVSEGGGTQRLRHATRKVVVSCKKTG